MQHEVHRLEHRNGGKIDWQIMVVIERWWGPDRNKGIRDISWCKLISGRADRVLTWLRKQESAGVRSVLTTEELAPGK